MSDFVLGPRLKTISLKTDECVIWPGAMREGYGVKKNGHTTINAHRYVYEKSTGKKIPKGWHIDHTCRNRRCINPKHLEPVSPSENKTRAWAASGGNYKHKNYKGEVSKATDKEKKTALAVGAGGTAAAGTGFALRPVDVPVPHAKKASRRIQRDVERKGTARVKDLRRVASGEGARLYNDRRVANLAGKISRSKKGFDPDRPLTVKRRKNGQMSVSDGNHRVRVAEMLGVKRVPVQIERSKEKAHVERAPWILRGYTKNRLKQARKPHKKLTPKQHKAMDKKTPGWAEKLNAAKSSSEGANGLKIARASKIGAAGAGAAVGGAYLYKERDELGFRR